MSTFRLFVTGAVVAGVALAWGSPPPGPIGNAGGDIRGEAVSPASFATSPMGPCGQPITNAVRTADDLMANRYSLSRFPAVTLPSDLRWNENPVNDPNWPYNLHTLRFTNALWAAWVETGRAAYRDRYEFILHDWYVDNPPSHSPSQWSWADHSAAWRGIVYACALQRLPRRAWLREAAMLHGRTLADESFYVHHGNHALNQAIGLLALGCTMKVSAWRTTAARRIARLASESIDPQGVTNEQAIGYQLYNFQRYSEAIADLRACGVAVPRSLDRVERMVQFLAHAMLPNGHMELIGDTMDDPLNAPPGTTAEFSATGGARGVRPTATAALYRAGFAFLRSGWGEDRPFAEETALDLRFGPARIFHGHVDAAALTLYAYGDRILTDPGLYRYRSDPMRRWFKSGAAHNTIEIDGRPMRPEGATRLLAWRNTPEWTYVAVAHAKIPGAEHVRRVFYSRTLDIALVMDDVSSARPGTVRQWWHLVPEARPRITADGFYTGRPASRANAWVVQLGRRVRHQVARGAMRPIQGWMSLSYADLTPAAAVAAVETGSRARFVTLIVPSSSPGRSWNVRSFRSFGEGFEVVVERGGITERIWVRGTEAAERVL